MSDALRSLRFIQKRIDRLEADVATKATSSDAATTYVTSAYADVTFVKSS